METDSPDLRTLRRALTVVGSELELSERLGATPAELRSWLAGKDKVPTFAFLAALDVVAGFKSARGALFGCRPLSAL